MCSLWLRLPYFVSSIIMKTALVFVFRRRLQDVLIKTNIFTLHIRLQKTSWPRPIYSSWSYVFKTVSRRLANMSSKHLQDVFKTSCKNVFKTSSRRLAKTSSRHLQDVFKMSCKDVFKTCSRCIIELIWCPWDVFKTFLKRSPKTVIYRRICLGHTSEKFMVSVQNLQEWQKFLKF